MGFLGKKWNELVYTLTSNDRYAGYHSSKAMKSLTTDSDDIANQIEEINMTNDSKSNTFYNDNLDESSYSIDEKQQAQLVLDAWHIIEDVINLDMKDPKNYFKLNPKNYGSYDDSEIDDLDDIPDAEDLLNSLSDPCTIKDLNVAQKHLGIKFPFPVIQYFLTHDGQEVPPSSTRKLGLIYGLQLLSLAEVVVMTNYWRKVSRRELNSKFVPKTVVENNVKEKELIENNEKEENMIINNDPNFQIVEKINKISENDLKNYPDLMRNISTHSKNDYIKKLPNQSSYPPKMIKLQYANSNWIPLVTDNAGNNIAIDLDPDTDGKIGQVIIFGREFDTKFVIADNWGDFMNKFALDFENPKRCNLDYDGDIGKFDLAYLDKNGNIVDQGYLYVLSQRAMGKDI
ncbi:hypothetical protein C6P40_000825 [Pichia californica]|uniref:Knr4/Smi1-like domain-containing protein n=1 Tax=Pichia californica TaxID=460514 RepID=A0A9P6WJZ4_9ASCO|nr:hypothetical protein C6P42_001451 [[Candida] californica]KAG0688569.1 hypothetical protein C6P40_000825 [[Candida] californica]